MEKRGQITTFIIVGIVLIFIVVLIFIFRNSILESVLGEQQTRNLLKNKIESIDMHIQNCIDEEAYPAVILLSKQGGTFNPINYLLYKEDKISYLCFRIKNTTMCENQMIPRSSLEKELYDYLYDRIESCIDINSFKSNQYTLESGNFDFNVKINDKNILFNVTYPITLERNEVRVSTSDFNKIVDFPLGDMEKATNDILNMESVAGDFDDVSYMLYTQNEITVFKKKPYPNKVYIIHHKDNANTFQFAIKDGAMV